MGVEERQGAKACKPKAAGRNQANHLFPKEPQADFSPKDAARTQGRGCDLNKSPKGEGPSKEGDEQA